MPKKSGPRDRPPDAPARKQTIQVISRAFSVLRALEDEPKGLSLGEIAQRVGLARSTVQRIVEALRSEQFLIAASPTAGVRLGPALVRLAASASVEFDDITRALLVLYMGAAPFGGPSFRYVQEHVAIYLGNGKMLESGGTADKVVVSSVRMAGLQPTVQRIIES